MKEPSILVVDDEPNVCQVIAAILEEEGFKVHRAHNGIDAMRIFFDQRPDLVILDILMPYKDGRDTCRQIREVSNTPIIMLSALGDEKEKVGRLTDGADDYIPKPFNNNELVARVRAVLRRTNATPSPADRVFDDSYLQVDLDSHRLQVGGETKKLTPREWRLLEYMIKHKNKILSRATLLRQIWGEGFEDADNILKVAISNLRGKIGDQARHPKYIRTEHSVGYRFEAHE
jgi:DNA-binding response OmpR family regulator